MAVALRSWRWAAHAGSSAQGHAHAVATAALSASPSSRRRLDTAEGQGNGPASWPDIVERRDFSGVPGMLIGHWNMLADGLAQFGNFDDVDRNIMEWSHRWPLLQRDLGAFPIDLLTLAEVSNWHEDVEPFLNQQGMNGVFVQKFGLEPRKFGDGEEFERDGVAIAWRKSEFTAISRQVEIQDPCAVLQPLVHKSTGRLVVLTGLHLKAKRGFESVRSEQIARVLDAVKAAIAASGQGQGASAVIGGDFNAEPDEMCVVRAAQNAEPLLNVVCPPVSIPPSKDTSEHFTTWKKRKSETRRVIDYVFGTPDIHTVAWLSPPACREQDPDATPYPTADYPSDHFMQLVEVDWD